MKKGSSFQLISIQPQNRGWGTFDTTHVCPPPSQSWGGHVPLSPLPIFLPMIIQAKPPLPLFLLSKEERRAQNMGFDGQVSFYH